MIWFTDEDHGPIRLLKNMEEEDRPREKLLLRGVDALTDAELIALLLNTGTRDTSALDLGRILLKKSAGLNGLAALSIPDLMKIKGIGKAKAITLSAAFELTRRRQRQLDKPQRVLDSASAGKYLLPRLQDLQQEVFYVLFLSRNHSIKAEKMMSMGGLTSTVVDFRLIFKEAISNLSSAIIVAHNHPSGSLEPSNADRELTRRLKESGKILDIPLIDHIIIGMQGYYSFADEGMI